MRFEKDITLESTCFNGHVQTNPITVKAAYSSMEEKWTLTWKHTKRKTDAIWVKSDSFEAGKLDLRRAIVRRFDPFEEMASKKISGSLSRSNSREHEILSEYIQKREDVVRALLFWRLVESFNNRESTLCTSQSEL